MPELAEVARIVHYIRKELVGKRVSKVIAKHDDLVFGKQHLSEAQVQELHSAIHYVCATSVDLLGDSSRFPTDWLMHHRWNKRSKQASKMLNGDLVTFITVGGRTSAIVPSVQKKSPVATTDATANQDDDNASAAKSGSGSRGKATSKKKADEGAAVNGTKASTSAKQTPTKKEAEIANGKTGGSVAQTASRKRKAATTEPEKAESKSATPAKRTRAAAVREEATGAKTPLRRGRSAAKK
ncbi:conserved hypothetical protein [Uncinocarpus reesii 1704]|uniref:Formamidopyrimidine-DNA glycosylase catalytic domain-containing protein n=1 Tax=Uncinocarpus reesii (strain UAMH 1704) TaxID=336963 RepID=C4JSA8_UNCRE|nr:uncharacterized protein UREG_05347 [Uncinocarpus reesii 1704]EEP80505.1 conserved hypothetical protein [Uncinocarpus reesii 1704]